MKLALAELKRSFHKKCCGKQPNLLETVEETLQEFFYTKTQSRPVILSNYVNV